MQMIIQQYEYIKDARGALLQYCATLDPGHFVQPLDDFNGKSIRDLLVHIADVYRYWLKKIALEQESSFPPSATFSSIQEVRELYSEADIIMQVFIQQFQQSWNQVISRQVQGRDGLMEITPWQIFTHVITHEFHHKGQVLYMSRRLGYTPPDTDVIRL
jgi:uncharacterized damage-inducible protein DinB